MTATQDFGEPLYEFTGRFTDLTEYGVSMKDAFAGKAAIPAAGLRVDLAFEGEVRGKLAGELRGVDYLSVRPDGRAELDVRGTVTTPNGSRIAVAAGGVGIPKPGSATTAIREHVKLTTGSPEYAWVNALEIWAVGEIDLEKGELTIRGYAP